MTRDRLLLALTILVIAIGAVLATVKPAHAEQKSLGFKSPIMALEMVQNWPQLTILLAAEDRDRFRTNTLIDFGFILAYGSLWIVMGWTYGEQFRLRYLIGACIFAATIFDVRENLAILRVLGLTSGFDDGMALAIRNAAVIKWGLLGAGWFVLAIALLNHQLWPMAVGYAFAAGVIATAFFTLDPVFELAGPVQGLTMLLQLVYFIRRSGMGPA